MMMMMAGQYVAFVTVCSLLRRTVVAVEAVALEFVEGNQLVQRIQGDEPGQHHGYHATGPPAMHWVGLLDIYVL